MATNRNRQTAKKFAKPTVAGAKKTAPTRANAPLAKSVNDLSNPAGPSVGPTARKPRVTPYPSASHRGTGNPLANAKSPSGGYFGN